MSGPCNTCAWRWKKASPNGNDLSKILNLPTCNSYRNSRSCWPYGRVFFSQRASGAALVASMLAAQLGCGGGFSKSTASAGSDRVLITHTENLSGDPALDGAARVVSHLVRSHLAGG